MDKKNNHKNHDTISALKCDAVHCVHNDKHCCCTANHVDIGNPQAEDKEQTKCKTFKCEC